MSRLAGRRILVTRAEHQAGRLSRELAAHGAEAIEIPAIRILPPTDFGPLDQSLRHLSSYGWMLVTSANTVNALLARIEELGMVSPGSQTWRTIFGPMPKIAAIGPASAKAVRRMGWKVDLIPEKYVAESLLQALGDKLQGQRVLLARSARARDVIPEALRAQGIELDVIDAYRTEIPHESVSQVKELFAAAGSKAADAATFTSSSTVENFLELLREAGYTAPPKDIPAISIGPVTSKTLRAAGWEPAVEAADHNIDGLVQAALEWFAR
ncbi:MAG: uroporphyrinogen-III synthase [Acidobacteriaceae bacterium]